MRLTLQRQGFFPTRTLGSLFIFNEFECYTLEDADRYLECGSAIKIPGHTAIPRGEYEVVLDMSQRFKKITPRLLNVPQFTGVRIHSGNTEADTEGCPLVGREIGPDQKSILESRIAFDALMAKLRQAKGKIFIEIV